jgi:hypothetical protein
VHEERLVVEKTPLLEALQGRLPEAAFRDLVIERILGDVDMAATTSGTAFRGIVEGPVGDCEAGVHAEGTAEARVIAVAVDEAQVLHQTCYCLVVTVAIGYFVTEDRTQPDLVDGLGDDREAVAHTRRRGVVIEEGGAAPANAVGEPEKGRQAYRLRSQSAVEAPPQELQDLPEVGRWCGRCETAGEGGVEMMVEIDETREDDPAACIETIGVWKSFVERCFGTDSYDAISRPGNGAVRKDHGRVPAGYHDAVVQEVDR